MAEKIVHLEIELEVMKLKEKEGVKVKEATKNIEDPKISTVKKEITSKEFRCEKCNYDCENSVL